MRIAAALVDVTFVEEIDVGELRQLDWCQPVVESTEIIGCVEIILHSLAVGRIVEQYITDEVGSSILTFLHVQCRNKEGIVELRVAWEVAIDARHRGIAVGFLQSNIRLCMNHLSQCALAWIENIGKRLRDDDRAWLIERIDVAFDHLNAKHLNETWSDILRFLGKAFRIVAYSSETTVFIKRKERTACYDMWRRGNDIVRKASWQDVAEHRVIIDLVGTKHPAGCWMTGIERQLIFNLMTYDQERREGTGKSDEVKHQRQRVLSHKVLDILEYHHIIAIIYVYSFFRLSFGLALAMRSVSNISTR